MLIFDRYFHIITFKIDRFILSFSVPSILTDFYIKDFNYNGFITIQTNYGEDYVDILHDDFNINRKDKEIVLNFFKTAKEVGVLYE